MGLMSRLGLYGSRNRRVSFRRAQIGESQDNVTVPLRAAVVALLLFAACNRQSAPPISFVQSLRCGMTRDEVRQLARESGYDNSDATWFARERRGSKQLSFVDLTFRADRLVAYRVDRYDPRTKRVERRSVDLCDRQSAPAVRR